MNNLTLNKPQIQSILNELVTREDGLTAMLEMTLNAFMKAERESYLHTSTVKNKGNGFRTAQGLGLGSRLSLRIPRDRLGSFKPWILDVMRESQDQMNDLFFELYSKGLTTRDIASITDSIYGKKLSSSSISRITQTFYEDMKLFRERDLDANYPIIQLDATFISTRRDKVSKEAYYVVLGVKEDATREVLGLYNAPTESSTFWDECLKDLKSRGLQTCGLFITDDLTGLNSIIEQNFESPIIQKCVVHLKRNILLPCKKIHKEEMANDLQTVFNLNDASDTKDKARQRSQAFYQKWKVFYSHLKKFNNPNEMDYYFNYLNFNIEIRNMIYTTNWIENLNGNFKKVISMRNSMPSPESVLTLLSKVAIDRNSTSYSYAIHRLKADSMFK